MRCRHVIFKCTIFVYSVWCTGRLLNPGCCNRIFNRLRKNNISVQRLILSGVAISSVLSSIQSIFLLTFDDTRIQNLLTWLSGTLAGRDWDDIKYTWIPIVGCGCISLLFGKQLNFAFLDSGTRNHGVVNL